MTKFDKGLKFIIIFLITAGIIDTSYLTYKHYFEPLGVCLSGIFGTCANILNSKYSIIFGIPLSIYGLINFLLLLILLQMSYFFKISFYKRLIFIQTAFGLVVSVYLTYIQLFVIKSICIFCLLSAVISAFLYYLVRKQWQEEYKYFTLIKIEFIYKLIAKPLFFILPAEFVHEQAMFWGRLIGSSGFIRIIFSNLFYFRNSILKQKIANIIFENPIGLAAGYDYTSSFFQILHPLGFGFETIGTITNMQSEGNDKPRLGRLPKTQSLLVNKGFRNPGAENIINILKNKTFSIPIGISIGKTNSIKIAGNQKEAVDDIISAFKKFEKSTVKHNYYELNISCPNLKGSVTFYPPNELKKLLSSIERLRIKRPIFVKMPIEKSDLEIRKMLKVISTYKFIKGVIIGNLQKDRTDIAFDKEEIRKAGKGNFSGRPTFRRSNEVIRLAYREFGDRLIIVGCGGVFTANDAYRKVRFGASLIQLITGMIFEGPQRISQINRDLVKLLQKDGYKNISEAIGVDVK